MQAVDPEAASRAMQLLNGGGPGGGKRDLKHFVSLVSTWQRTRQVSLDRRNKEMTKKDFWGYWQSRNRKDPSIQKKWDKATSPAMFRRKRAWKDSSGKVWVWQPLQREMHSRDIISATLSGQPQDIVCGKAQANEWKHNQVCECTTGFF